MTTKNILGLNLDIVNQKWKDHVEDNKMLLALVDDDGLLHIINNSIIEKSAENEIVGHVDNMMLYVRRNHFLKEHIIVSTGTKKIINKIRKGNGVTTIEMEKELMNTYVTRTNGKKGELNKFFNIFFEKNIVSA